MIFQKKALLCSSMVLYSSIYCSAQSFLPSTSPSDFPTFEEITDKQDLEGIFNTRHFFEYNFPESPKARIKRHRHKHDANGSRTSDSSYSRSEDPNYKKVKETDSPTPLRPGFALRGLDNPTKSPTLGPEVEKEGPVEAVAAAGLKSHVASIAAIARGNPNLSTFVGAMSVVALDKPMSEAGNYTVFAPTNEAFSKLPGGTIEQYIAPGWSLHLEDIILSHVSSGYVESKNLVDGAEINTLNGDSMLITKDTVPLINGYISVTETDEASNGILEIVDGVILPPSALLNIKRYAEIVSDIDVIPFSFKSFLNLLKSAELEDYIATESPITVLTPTDKAMEKLDAQFVDFLNQTSKDMLVKLLKYHIIEGNRYSKTLLSIQNVSMMNGDTVRIYQHIGFGKYKMKQMNINMKANVIDSDVLSNNGVIHVIDTLLVPDDVKKAYETYKSNL